MKKTIVLYTLIFAAILALLTYFSCSNSGSKSRATGYDEDSPIKNDIDIKSAWNIQKAFRKIYDLYHDRVVFISTEERVTLPDHPFYELFGIPRIQKQTGLGSGFIISSDGFICTNFHVIAPGGTIVEKVTVIMENDRYEAEVRGFDAKKDIAILKIKPKDSLNSVFFGNSDQVEVGDWAIAIGNPFGLSKSFTVGVVSATARKNIELDDNSSFIQTDAAINPGNSGGPLINIRGEVIGVNRMIFSKSGGYMGIGFAIPINSIKELMEDLKQIKYVHKGYIGVSLHPMDADFAQRLGWPNNYGVIIESIMAGGPADAAGLERFDIIYAINGMKVTDINDMIAIIEKAGPNKRILLNIFRTGKKYRVEVETTKKPAE